MNSSASPTFRPLPARRATVLGSIALLLCASAQAQAVRKCHVDGRLVFQSAPCAVDVPAGAVATVAAPLKATVDPDAPPKKKTLADLLRERDEGDRPAPRKRESQPDGANVLRSRMGAI